MNSESISPKTSKGRSVLKVITTVVCAILLLLIVSWLVMTYFPSTNFQAWFYETRYIWLGWRFGLYGVIWFLMLLINRKRKLPSKARLLILLAIPIIEGINLMYLL